MNLRFPTAAGFLAAASLLSGSAFAFAPEFTGDLPTVVITDQLQAPSTQFDPGQGTTQGIFRYTSAFDIFDYIDLKGNNPANVKLLFNEFNDDISVVPNTTGKTLSINGRTAYAAGSNLFPTTSADFPSGSEINASATGTGDNQGFLNFQNIDFSPGVINPPHAFDYVGDVTGWDLVASGPQSRVVQLYLAGSPSTSVSAPKNFEVITKIGEGDSLTTGAGSSNPWTSVVATSNDFSGWTGTGLGLMAIIPENGSFTPIKKWASAGAAPGGQAYNALGTDFTDFSGFVLNPAVTINGAGAPNGTTQLTVTIPGTKHGFVGWARPSQNILAANKIYRLRSRVASPTLATREEWRVRFGNEALVGQSSSGYLKSEGAGFPYLGTTATDHYSYLLTKGTGTTNAFSIFYEVISESISQNGQNGSGTRGQDLQISQYEISSTDRSALTGASVVFNQGGTVAALAAGESTTVAGSPTAFTTSGPNGTALQLLNLWDGTVPSSTQPRAGILGAGGSNYTLRVNPQVGTPPSGEVGKHWFSRFYYNGTTEGPTDAGNFVVTAGKLYILDVFLSSPQANGTQPFPQLRLELQLAGKQAEFAIYELNTSGVNLGLTTAPRAYHVVGEAQYHEYNPGSSTVYGNSFVDFISNTGEAYNTATDIVLSRITVTEYNASH